MGQQTTSLQLYQMVHKRPMVGGHVARAPSELIYDSAEAPVLDFLSNPSSPPSDRDKDPEAIAYVMDKYKIAFIVVHKLNQVWLSNGTSMRLNTENGPEELNKIDSYVTEFLGMEKFEETDDLIAYRRAGGSGPISALPPE